MMNEMSQEEFNYWEAVAYYQNQGYSKEEAEKQAYKDLMTVFNKACEIIDNK